MNIEQHLLDRHLDIGLHRPVIDEVNGVASFYLWNLSGCLVGYQQYRPEADKKQKNDPRDGRYFTYRAKNTIAVWGLESLHLSDTIFVCEGIFDACRMTEIGCSAIAILSNNSGWDLRNWFGSLNRKVVAICDNNAAGRQLAKFGDYSVITDELDLGDSSEEYVISLKQKYC